MNADLYTHRNSAPAITITSATAQQLSAISVDNNNTKRPDPPRKKWSTTTIPVLSSLDESLILGHHATFGTYRQSFDLSGYMDENRSLNTSESNLSETTNSTSSITGEYEKYKNSRRKSWHVGKRRKSVMGVSHVATISPPSGFDRKHGKRGSWWSLLVPESWPRTRRASTVGIDSNGSRHDDNIPYHRNKSRSVDHGFASPFDLDSLRSKVEGRFESVDKLHSGMDYQLLHSSASSLEEEPTLIRGGFGSSSVRIKFEKSHPSRIKFEKAHPSRSPTPEDDYVVVFMSEIDGDSASKENIAGKMQKPSEPIKTTTYTVEASDTLSAVAARFDTTPSELAILNRLTSRTVFPGQTIRVPEKTTKRQRKARVLSENQTSSGNEEGEGTEDGDESGELESETNESDVSSTHRRLSANECESTEECELLESLRPASPKPGHVERIRAPLGASYANRPRHAAPQERFLKIHVRHITDGQGVVAGVLLVTPNAVMFDPNVSDTLVIEHGAEAYGVIAPMEFVVNAAIYHDIAHMRVAHIQQKHDPNVKQEIYHLKHRDSISAEGGANLYRSTEKEEEEEKEEKEEHTKENEGEEDRVNVQNEVESTKPVSQTSDDTCSCGGGEEPPTSSPPHSPPTSTPPNTSHSSTCEDASSVLDAEQIIRKLEERRQSSLDHHWPVPRSYVMEQQALSQEKMDEVQPRPLSSGPASSPSPSPLVKTDCHDSGIDIRDPGSYPGALPTPPPRKAAYSDADILLSDSNEFIPPMPILPLPSGADDRRKAASVSFQVDQSLVQDPTGQAPPGVCDKQETKKKNMLKRLSYPLAWMEGFSSDKEDKESLPSSGDSSQPASSHSSSVFSKVFSSSPINMVTDLGSGIAGFMKTPSEEGGRFPFPPTTPSGVGGEMGGALPGGGGSMGSLVNSFSPASIMNSVGRPSVSTFIRSQHSAHSPQRSVSTSGGAAHPPPPPKLNYHSMVSVDDMPELFVAFDKLIPRPARSCDDPPLYLRLRMGKPKHRPISRSTPIMSYGKKKMRPEYWFSVPRNRVDELYKFLMLWVPHLYGDLDEAQVNGRGFELVDSDTELWEEEGEAGGSPRRRGSEEEEGADPMAAAGELGRESWEVIKAPYTKLYTILKSQADQFSSSDSQTIEEHPLMCEELRRALYANPSLDFDLCVPDLNGVTEILTEDHRKDLCRHLPARAEGYTWTLVFSTSQHGFSLSSLYRKMSRIESPILLVIQDTDCNVFGALTSCSLKTSDHFYGTGESLLFSFTPDLQVYNWTGDNMYFIKGNNESLSIGAGDGKFGLWLDGDLYQGRSEPCSTYGNEPLSPQQDFVVKTLECWAFI